MAVTFVGEPPFQLPLLQNAQADALDETVLMTLYGLIDGHGPSPVPMMVQMTGKTALALSAQLSRAGLAAELKARS
jgi:hypothetical protein